MPEFRVAIDDAEQGRRQPTRHEVVREPLPRNLAGDVLTVATGFDAAGAGRAAVTYVAAGGGTGSFDQCWDAAACLSYVLDPANFSCPLHASCSFGSVIPDCPAVPVSPF